MEVKEAPSFKVEFLSTSGVYKTSFSLIILLQFFVGGMILVLINLWFVNHIYFLLTGGAVINLLVNFCNNLWAVQRTAAK